MAICDGTHHEYFNWLTFCEHLDKEYEVFNNYTVGVKKIEKLDFPSMWESGIATEKINELITAFNSLPPTDKIMVKE